MRADLLTDRRHGDVGAERKDAHAENQTDCADNKHHENVIGDGGNGETECSDNQGNWDDRFEGFHYFFMQV